MQGGARVASAQGECGGFQVMRSGTIWWPPLYPVVLFQLSTLWCVLSLCFELKYLDSKIPTEMVVSCIQWSCCQ